MIVSASRRTDSPAYYGRWLLERIRCGFCEVANPFNPKQIKRVELAPELVECLVFWTRHPKSLLPYLGELDSRGFFYYFTYTVLAYPRYFEPQLPALESRLTMFKRTADRIGASRVVWRYDPILFTEVTGPQFHLEQFEHLCEELSGFTDTVMVSLFDFYRKLEPRMRRLAEAGAGRTYLEDEPAQLIPTLGRMREIAGAHQITMRSCAEDHDLTGTGITEGACIDPDRIETLLGGQFERSKDSGQRRLCNCIPSVDIGAYDTCPAGCAYCYATGRPERVSERYRRHDPDASRLA